MTVSTPSMGTTAEATEWTLAEAQSQFASLSALAEECGFRMALLGSVLKKGSGRDLDLLMRPLRGKPQRREAFLARFGGTMVKPRWNAGRGIDGCQVELGGKLYDFVFGEFWDQQVVRTWARKS